MPADGTDFGQPTIAIFGCGRMGSAFARVWTGRARVLFHDPAVPTIRGCARLDDPADLPPGATILLAVKPQAIAAVAASLRPHLRNSLVVSIAAGIRLATLRAALGPAPQIARAMPSTAVALGRGITAITMDGDVGLAARAEIEELFDATGKLVWLAEEALLDVVTAVSGSGPAYFFRIAEALATAGEEHGLDRATALALAQATLAGAGALAATDDPLAHLREAVTSPGGTTAAGLAALDGGGIDILLRAAIYAAHRRAAELGRDHAT